MAYAIGDLVQITATFTALASKAPVNPTTVTFTVRKPDGTVSNPAASSSATGVFTAQLPIDQSGTWRWRAVGTGAAQAAEESDFLVEPDSF